MSSWHDPEHESRMRAQRPGVWIAAGPSGLADQTYELMSERAMFFPVSLSQETRDQLAKADQLASGKGREDPVKKQLMEAIETLARDSQNKEDQRLLAAIQEENLWEGFIPHTSGQTPLWGVVELIFNAGALCDPPLEDVWKASDKQREKALDLSAKIAEKWIQNLARDWNLGAPLLDETFQGRVRWGADDQPECWDEPLREKALAELEKWTFETASRPGKVTKKSAL